MGYSVWKKECSHASSLETSSDWTKSFEFLQNYVQLSNLTYLYLFYIISCFTYLFLTIILCVYTTPRKWGVDT